jgi:acyl-CoA thioesterase YciA
VFHAPVYVGDIVSFYAELLRIGTTSITVKVVVEAAPVGPAARSRRVTEAEITYVNVDARGRPEAIARSKGGKTTRPRGATARRTSKADTRSTRE